MSQDSEVAKKLMDSIKKRKKEINHQTGDGKTNEL